MAPDPAAQREEQLVQRAAKGNRQAFGTLYECYLDQIYRYVYYRVSDPLDAEDLTELTFLKTWESLPRIKVRHFRAWLYRVAHNLVVDHLRTRKEHTALPNTMPDDTLALEQQLQQDEEVQRLTGALKQLDARLQEVIVCRFINHLSHAETARVLKLSEGNVRVLQHRALQKLRSALSETVSQ